MTRRKHLASLFEAMAIASEAMLQAEHAFHTAPHADSGLVVRAFLTWQVCSAVYLRARDKYTRALSAVESDDLEQQLEASLAEAP